MIATAEITSIDYTSNSCVVRIPLFETVNTLDNVEIPGKLMSQPGQYNGYKVGDTVWVAFMNGRANTPVVIGKIFKGAENEKNAGSAISCGSLDVNGSAVLPSSTEISGADSQYDSLQKLINGLKTLYQQLGVNPPGDDSPDTAGKRYQTTVTVYANEAKTTVTDRLSFISKHSYSSPAMLAQQLEQCCNSTDKWLRVTTELQSDILGIYASSGKLYSIKRGARLAPVILWADVSSISIEEL